MQRCPLCRARLRDQDLCPRCGAELRLARQAEDTARTLEAQALRAIAAGDRETALRVLTRAALFKRHEIQGRLWGMLRQPGHHRDASDATGAPSEDTPDAEEAVADADGHQDAIPPILPRRWWS